MKPLLMLLMLTSAFVASAAEDTIYLEETVITGNQELPKVLYILPWREMDTALLPERVLEYTAQSVLVPVYPEEQRRELRFRQLLSEARRTETDKSNQADPEQQHLD